MSARLVLSACLCLRWVHVEAFELRPGLAPRHLAPRKLCSPLLLAKKGKKKGKKREEARRERAAARAPPAPPLSTDPGFPTPLAAPEEPGPGPQWAAPAANGGGAADDDPMGRPYMGLLDPGPGPQWDAAPAANGGAADDDDPMGRPYMGLLDEAAKPKLPSFEVPRMEELPFEMPKVDLPKVCVLAHTACILRPSSCSERGLRGGTQGGPAQGGPALL